MKKVLIIVAIAGFGLMFSGCASQPEITSMHVKNSMDSTAAHGYAGNVYFKNMQAGHYDDAETILGAKKLLAEVALLEAGSAKNSSDKSYNKK